MENSSTGARKEVRKCGCGRVCNSSPVALFCSREYVRSSAEGEVGEGFRREETRGKQSPGSGPVELGQ